ncbi:MAG: O-methyltransferase [Planctomycetes bacterium]|nr:O-methyltransferase [Planctomycetota bacterium]
MLEHQDKDQVSVGPAHFAYLRDRTTREDAFLAALRVEAQKAGLPPIAIQPEQGACLQVLLRLCNAREVVEIGTLGGYSAIWMARALPDDGRVRTIEVDPERANFAEHWIARSDVAGRIEVHRGRGDDVLRKFASDSADAAFLDADKAGYPGYLRECLRIVRIGGLIAADNALAFGQLLDVKPTDPDVPAVRAFNDLVPTVAEIQAVIVPLGDGMWVGVRVG